jgi:hypothetical protein
MLLTDRRTAMAKSGKIGGSGIELSLVDWQVKRADVSPLAPAGIWVFATVTDGRHAWTSATAFTGHTDSDDLGKPLPHLSALMASLILATGHSTTAHVPRHVLCVS